MNKPRGPLSGAVIAPYDSGGASNTAREHPLEEGSMEKKTTVICEYCGNSVIKAAREVTRSIKLGRRLFCNNSCGAKFGNKKATIPTTHKSCEFCGTLFETKEWGKRANRFCSRICASAGSVTELRRAASSRVGLATLENLLPMSDTLKLREAWKYVNLLPRLKNFPHEFECKIGNYIFDLVLPTVKVAVEFDGPNHRGTKQREVDWNKSKMAEVLGYLVLHREVKRASVFPASILDGIV